MKYIESLREGERINEIYLCKSKQKQGYADKMLHLDGNRFVDSKVNEKKP